MEELRIEHDGSGHPYVRTGNVRVTFLPESSWADGPGVRIQAYRDDTSSALHRGAELSLTLANGYALIAAIALLLANNRPG